MPTVPKYSVLCFGDSNTWGFVPGSGARYPIDVRWPGVLRAELGPEYWVIEEGLNGRTTIWDDPEVAGRNGHRYLVPCLQTHRPLDLIVVCLGLNDQKARFSATPEEIAKGVGTLLRTIRESGAGNGDGALRTLVMSPPRIGRLSGYADQFEGALPKSAVIGACIAAVAREYGSEYLDTSGLIATSDLDGIHLEAGEHRKLALAVAESVRRILGAGR
jgi:lysophospholipase L1-like esterase